jgi:electron-transferring-flavoprotein dehydrogenase
VNGHRETLEFDIVLVGGGPASLAAAIHLQNLSERRGLPEGPSVVILDKGRYPGAHLLSGGVLDPRAIGELLPDYRELGAPLGAFVCGESLLFLTRNRHFPFPRIPEPFRNEGNVLLSLSAFGSWLAGIAESRGAVFLDRTAAVSPFIRNGAVAGVVTGDKGRARDGSMKPDFEPGMVILGRAVLIGEGADGSLFNQLDREYGLRADSGPQLYETGVKEVWRIPGGLMEPGSVTHTFGYPLTSRSYGGGWMYANSENELSLGFVTSVGRGEPSADPHGNLQLFKEHPSVRKVIGGGTLLEYGAKVITSGGVSAMPRLHGPGFLVAGESAGLVNMQRLKGLHLAMKSGMLAAETLFDAWLAGDFSAERLETYEHALKNSWAYREMQEAGNYRQAFGHGLYRGLLQAGLGLALPSFPREPKEVQDLPPKEAAAENRLSFRPDGILTFDRSRSLYSSGTQHEEDQPCHLAVDPGDVAAVCLQRCTREYGNPCRNFCPAGVYEIVGQPASELRITPSNCLHCKTCEIADPYGVILWKVPEGGGGPGYKLS